MVAGNIKFDQPVPDFNKTGLLELKNNLGLENNTVVFLAGSTHEGEEIILADLFKDLKEQVPELVMVIVPRDPKRCKALLPVFLQRNINTALMSQLDKGQLKTDNPAFSHAILIDQMGLLAKLYAVCDLAFVGGSMVPEGGHNPLEPAAFSKPILFGPHMTDFDLIAKLLTQNIGGAMTVDSKKDLKRAATDILTDKQKQRQMGSNNYKVFCENSGAVQRIINHLEHMDFV
ncbi:MAG: hypothetical protein GY729_20020 [Desulfobacteraceae bacterium]|nr:hypothetical protein [Desulfobacteraceae bacterium]